MIRNGLFGAYPSSIRLEANAASHRQYHASPSLSWYRSSTDFACHDDRFEGMAMARFEAAREAAGL